MNIQIFGSSKSFDSKKAERWFKERRIKYQYIDVPSKGLSPREYQSVKQKVGFEALVNTKCRAYEELYMAYITPDAQEEKLLEYPELFNTPLSAMARRPLWATARTSGPNGSKIFPEGETAMWDNTCRKNRFLRFCALMAHRCGRHNVAMQSAALAFYLLFMIFPFLIFISALLGLLDLNITGMMTVLSDFLPEEVVDLLRMYFTYVTTIPAPNSWYSVWSFPSTSHAGHQLSDGRRATAYHLGRPRALSPNGSRCCFYTVTLIVTIALTLSLMTFGERALWYTVEHFHLPEFLAKLWVTLRFPVAGAVSFLALFLLYALAQDTIQP